MPFSIEVASPSVKEEFVHSQLKYRKLLEYLITYRTTWLDVGCGHTIFPSWMSDYVAAQKRLINKCVFAIGCDPIDGSEHVAGMTKLNVLRPFAVFEERTFNLITANMVIEHVKYPAMFMHELWLLLKDDGLCIIHTPNKYYWPLFIASYMPTWLVQKIAHSVDKRDNNDIFPTYYRMNTEKDFRRLKNFTFVSIDCVPTASQFTKIPVLKHIEIIMRIVTKNVKWLQADWIVVLQKKG